MNDKEILSVVIVTVLDIAKLNIVSVLDCVSLGGHNQEREREYSWVKEGLMQ